MTAPTLDHAPPTEPDDPIHRAVERLRRALPERTDVAVLLGFLEDDLREGLAAIAEVEAHFQGAVELLAKDRPSPIALLNAGDDLRVLERLDYLNLVTTQLRRRLAQAALRLRDARALTT